MNNDEIRSRYIAMLGSVPEGIEQRLRLAERIGDTRSLTAIEGMREALMDHNHLTEKVEQLVHLGMLLVTGHRGPALIHARAALRAGADAAQLFGVCQTAAVVGGMPAFSLGVAVVTEALDELDAATQGKGAS
ncbi:MAG: carboxymuconolactone decarboxylase family protein [Persicimonas sp.]